MFLLTLLSIGIAISIVDGQTAYPCDINAPCGCSLTPAVVTSRILGGETAVNGSWGWTVSILLNNTNYCGGILISQSWVLSSASCTSVFRSWEILVSAATNIFLGGKQVRSVISVNRHPNFNTNTWANDLTLLQLSSPFNMTDLAIARICLPLETNTDYPPVNSSMVAVGWGPIASGGNPSTFLQQVTLQRVAFNTFGCNASLVSNQTIQMCGTGGNGTKGVCAGDGGGPVMMYTPSQQWVLVGVISFSVRCSNTGYPSIMTRATSALAWIKSMNISDLVTVSDVTLTTTVTTVTTTNGTTTTATTTTSRTTTSVTTSTDTSTTTTTITTSTTTSTASTTILSTTTTQAGNKASKHLSFSFIHILPSTFTVMLRFRVY